LTDIDLTTFVGDAVDASCFQAKVILHGPKETGDFSRLEPTVNVLFAPC
jgi:hypothetical protein